MLCILHLIHPGWFFLLSKARSSVQHAAATSLTTNVFGLVVGQVKIFCMFFNLGCSQWGFRFRTSPARKLPQTTRSFFHKLTLLGTWLRQHGEDTPSQCPRWESGPYSCDVTALPLCHCALAGYWISESFCLIILVLASARKIPFR